MTRLDRYILRQLVAALGFFLLVFTGVIWLTQAVRLIDTVVASGQSARVFLEFSGLVLPQVLVIVLPLAGIGAALHALNKLYTDSELVVMMSAGLGPAAMLRPVAIFGGAARRRHAGGADGAGAAHRRDPRRAHPRDPLRPRQRADRRAAVPAPDHRADAVHRRRRRQRRDGRHLHQRPARPGPLGHLLGRGGAAPARGDGGAAGDARGRGAGRAARRASSPRSASTSSSSTSATCCARKGTGCRGRPSIR